MLTHKVKRYFENPALGALPVIVFIVLFTTCLPNVYAIIIGLALGALGDGLVRYFRINRVSQISFALTLLSLCAVLIAWFLGEHYIKNHTTYIIICEVVYVFGLMFIRLVKTFLNLYFTRNNTPANNILIKDLLETPELIQAALTIHLLCILVFKQVVFGYYNPVVDIYVTASGPLVIFILAIIYQSLRLRSFRRKLEAEDWLPIVTEDGAVKGRIARQVSFNMGNRYMHPIIRIALVCKDKLYIQERPKNMVIDPGMLDYPFEKYLRYNHDFDEAISNVIQKINGKPIDSNAEFLMKYVFENAKTLRLVFLYIMRIEDESMVNSSYPRITGKFWTVKQLDEDFGKGVFSEQFELEYEYMKHAVLLKSRGEKQKAQASNV